MNIHEKDEASVVKSVNTADLKSAGVSLDGSSPSRGTKLTWKDQLWWTWVGVMAIVGVIDGNMLALGGVTVVIFLEFAGL